MRRIRDFVISFLQIPPRDGHPCLDGWFRSLRSIGDLHPLNAHHYSTHQAETPVPPSSLAATTAPPERRRQAKLPAPPSSNAATKRGLQPAVTGEPPVPPRTRRRLRTFEGAVIQPENILRELRRIELSVIPSSMAATKRRLQPAVTGEPPVPPRIRRRLRTFEGAVIQRENI